MRLEIPESDVTENPDGTPEARREGNSVSAPADVSGTTVRELELECPAARVLWSLEPDGETR
ncbi:hypothetical protein GCM10022252_49870 [Streptosporangium oxazolinicum]|uniref:Uncharacterized protein n=1 Tax=Streptosporangium oxazolinicum TaxID=909287 RepID=A0ABP8B6K1_9ACTN